ncbi:MAG: GntR family transcriptional regulator [Pseudomonadota bacterium]|nr:GntR family transcriptional regulator [Pseudomonadota bacterium]
MTSLAPSFRPLYLQIRDMLEQRLESGEWAPGECIPSEADLALRLGVAQGTVRKAIEALVSANLLIRRQGKGTYVASHINENVSPFRFLRIRRDDGVDEYPASRLIELRRSKAGGEMARLLALNPGEPVLVVRRVLEYQGDATVLDDITLPYVLFKGLTKARLAEYRGSMYGLFESEFGVYMRRAEERLRAVAADLQAARILGVATGTPLLAVDRVTFTHGDRPVEVRRGLCTTKRHHYANTLR